MAQQTIPADFTAQSFQNALAAFQFFMSKGLSAAAAAGIVGNMVHENPGFDPELASVDSNGLISYGLVEWNVGSPVYAANQSKLQTGNSSADFTAQLNEIYDEVQTNPMLKAALDSATTPTAAGQSFAQLFEKCKYCGPGPGTAGDSETISRGVTAAGFYAAAIGAAGGASGSIGSVLFAGPNSPADAALNAGTALETGGASVITSNSTLDKLGLGQLSTLLGDITSSSFWERIGIFALGLGLTIGGALIFFHESAGKAAETLGAAALVA